MADKKINRVILECKITSNVFTKSAKQGDSESHTHFEVGNQSYRFQVIYADKPDVINKLKLKKNLFIKVYGELKENYGDVFIYAHGIVTKDCPIPKGIIDGKPAIVPRA